MLEQHLCLIYFFYFKILAALVIAKLIFVFVCVEIDIKLFTAKNNKRMLNEKNTFFNV